MMPFGLLANTAVAGYSGIHPDTNSLFCDAHCSEGGSHRRVSKDDDGGTSDCYGSMT